MQDFVADGTSVLVGKYMIVRQRVRLVAAIDAYKRAQRAGGDLVVTR
jgi:hypothetical protein